VIEIPSRVATSCGVRRFGLGRVLLIKRSFQQ
jgi:hypothetical protein